jgi:hypothetical protein
MDSEVSKLIAKAEENKSKIFLIICSYITYSDRIKKGLSYLKQAFQILDPESHKDDNNKNNGSVENLSQNLYVLCAETAIHVCI